MAAHLFIGKLQEVKPFDELMTQPTRHLMASIHQLAPPENCLFTPADLRALVPDLSDTAFKTLLSRAASQEHLTRVCRGLYAYAPTKPDDSLVPYHAVSKLRPMSLNYLGLESVLSDAGVISQIPIQLITVMSSGPITVIDCGRWGSIEFVRTHQDLRQRSDLAPALQPSARGASDR
jgi:hypothetical protein